MGQKRIKQRKNHSELGAGWLKRREDNQKNAELRGEDREWKTEGFPCQGIKKEVARNAFDRCA